MKSTDPLGHHPLAVRTYYARGMQKARRLACFHRAAIMIITLGYTTSPEEAGIVEDGIFVKPALKRRRYCRGAPQIGCDI